ncbi:low temperature requirement protein A [Kineococcus radiotolerans]|uniref:Low temperature requirement A n=1 Tax=Kineococcus radiotolerans (strain ATCC BAA-149 / DSM 14245 / SRS30216) TaxID=266940 RepID=A6W9D3_KINRD|nr:low temperature requirement protein A [Kineococcus radiotolerans]ABS03422.1 low temperature requirement A [Kineococcus radiotolerans SRS30216 = ATCC BAA-149]
MTAQDRAVTVVPPSRRRHPGLRPMTPRDRSESHRVASPLELFFDLVFVVAVSLAAVELHHALVGGHALDGLVHYAVVFFAVWWAWVNFTWFASAFDTDDWLHRVLTFAQMAGVLVLAAGVHDVFADGDLTVVTAGYVVMRVAAVVQWSRAARGDVGLRRTATRYAVGIAVVQLAWVARLLVPDQGGLRTFVLLALAELAVPVWAERRGPTPWHPHHVAERYGLFTLIVLGESILASANAVIDALQDTEHLPALLLLAGSSLTLAAGAWWVYFSAEHHRRLTGVRQALVYGYGHYLVFAAAGAFSAGVEVLIDHESGHGDLSPVAAAATVTVPVAVFLLVVWWLVLRHELTPARSTTVLVLSLAAGAGALLPQAPLWAALAVVAAVVVVQGAAASPPRVQDPAGV